MATFYSTIPYGKQAEIRREYGHVSSDLGGVLSEWDTGKPPLDRFSITWEPLDSGQRYIVILFLGDQALSEPTTLAHQGDTYVGVFLAGYDMHHHKQSVYSITATFVGEKQ